MNSSALLELLAERSESPIDVFSGVYRSCGHSISDGYTVNHATVP